METINKELALWLQQLGIAEGYVNLVVTATSIFVILLIASILGSVFRKIVIPIIRKVTSKTGNSWDDHILNDEVLGYVCKLIPPIVVSAFLPLALHGMPVLLSWSLRIIWIYIIIIAVKLVCAFISSLYAISCENEKYKGQSLKGFYQMLKLVVICIGVIIIISTLLDKNPLVILTGLGAGTAVLMLVFQDTIKGLVAGIQLSANDMLRPGDWISMPKYGADGDVIEVTLNTVKVRNWDNTITMIPPYTLVSVPFKNWRGMQESGGRRADKCIFIDLNSLMVCTDEMIGRIRADLPLMAENKEDNASAILTNVQLYRLYIERYLRHHPDVNQDLDIIVTQKEATAYGLPIEVYFFTREKAWAVYERKQSDIFDHLMTVAPDFGLRIYQRP
jgi:miniconductance mechanosensitive channel